MEAAMLCRTGQTATHCAGRTPCVCLDLMSQGTGKKPKKTSAPLERLSFAVLMLNLSIFAIAILISIIYLQQRSGEEALFITTNILIVILGSIGVWLLHYTLSSQQQLKRALEKSEEEYRTLVSNINLGIYRNTGGPKGKFLQANPAIAKMCGYDSVEEFMKLAVSDIYQDPAQRAKYIEKIAKQGLVKDEILKLKRKDGTTFLGSVTAKVKYDNNGDIVWIDSAMEDVTKQKGSEEKLREAKRHLEVEAMNTKKFLQAVENSSVATIITTPEPSIVYANPAWEQLTGHTEAEVLGKNPNISKSGDTPRRVYEEMWGKILSGEEFHTDEIVNRRKDGTEYAADLRVYPITEHGKVQFLVGLQTDITAQKRAERAKSEFVSLASHQLRTPLTNLRWAFEVLEHGKIGKLPDEMQKIVERAQSFITQMNQTVSTLLNISRIEAGKIQVRDEKVPIGRLLEDIQEEYQSALAVKKQSFTINCPKELSLMTDESLLYEILTNLVSNASKYTPERGSVTLEVKQEGDAVSIRVSDTGYGIPADQQKQIFSKFFRGGNVIKHETSGTGLGLYLVYNLVRILSGSISFSSEENKGTTFTVSLPSTPPPHS